MSYQGSVLISFFFISYTQMIEKNKKKKIYGWDKVLQIKLGLYLCHDTIIFFMLRSWAIIIEIFELFLIVWLEDLEIASVYCVRFGDVRNFSRVISGVAWGRKKKFAFFGSLRKWSSWGFLGFLTFQFSNRKERG